MDWTAFWLTLHLGAWTCVLLLPVGILTGRWLAYTRFSGRLAIEALLMLPLVLPPTVLGFYLLTGFAPGTVAGDAVRALSGHDLAFTFSGVVFASVLINIPFAVQPMLRAFEAVPANVREAAWVSGLSPWQTFLKIELPLVWSGVVSALALVFAHTLGEFGVILMIGGNIPGETQTLSIALYDRVQAFRNDEAAVMALALLITSVIAVGFVTWTARPPGPAR